MPEAKKDLQKVHTLAKTTVLCQSFSPLVFDIDLPSNIGAYLSNHRMHGTTYPTNHELKGLTVQISAILMVE